MQSQTLQLYEADSQKKKKKKKGGEKRSQSTLLVTGSSDVFNVNTSSNVTVNLFTIPREPTLRIQQTGVRLMIHADKHVVGAHLSIT